MNWKDVKTGDSLIITKYDIMPDRVGHIVIVKRVRELSMDVESIDFPYREWLIDDVTHESFELAPNTIRIIRGLDEL